MVKVVILLTILNLLIAAYTCNKEPYLSINLTCSIVIDKNFNWHAYCYTFCETNIKTKEDNIAVQFQ